jgi:hypothetical protein
MIECRAEEETALPRLWSPSDFPWVRSHPPRHGNHHVDHDARHAGHGVGGMGEMPLILKVVEGKPVVTATGAR